MNGNNRLAPWMLAAGLLVCAGSALGQGMPPGAMQWIKLAGNYPRTATAVGALEYPSPNYVVDPQWTQFGCTVYANADSTPNRLRNSYWRWRTDSIFLSNAMVDTYTITGPAGSAGTPVTAHVRLTPRGNLFVGPRLLGSTTIYCCASFLQVKVGTWNPSSDPGFLEQFRVAEFAPNFFGQQSIPSQNYGSTQPIVPVTLVVEGDVLRTVGQPFDVGYMITTNGEGVGNVPGTTTPGESEYLAYSVHWDLPPGYSITSLRGWTDPDAPPPPGCGSADFNGDGDIGTDADIEAFFTCLGGTCCGTCDTHGADFNGDGDIGTDADIESFFRVLGGGDC